jgi:WD40 repeat protein
MRVLSVADNQHWERSTVPPCRVAFTPCGRWLVGHVGFYLAKWNLTAATGLPVWLTQVGDIGMGMAVSPCGRYAAVAGDRNPLVFDIASPRPPKAKWLRHPDHISDVAFTPDGKHLLTVAHEEGEGVRRWQVGSWRRATGFGRRGRLHGRPDGFGGMLAVSPDGELVATDHFARGRKKSDGPVHAIHLWSPTTGRKGGTIDCAGEDPVRFRFSPDGSRLVAILDWKRVRTWDVAGGELVAVYEPKPQSRRKNPETVSGVAHHPNGRVVAVVGDKSRCELLDADTLRPLRCYRWPVKHPFSVAFSTDGTLCAVGGHHGTVVVFDVDV